ncbi:hypothetical protein ABZ568_00455 [Streptomyces olindensis]|uniref:Uncharacterized protein n=1 Tax=Streptomyces olindensis TaxID=358823 RepID=A0ABV2XLP8_9ACTN
MRYFRNPGGGIAAYGGLTEDAGQVLTNTGLVEVGESEWQAQLDVAPLLLELPAGEEQGG